VVANAVDDATRRSLRRVINATGVVLHTNLGRAPLAAVALDAIDRVARGFSNLEYDVASGQRGSRYSHCASLLRELTGAEDALVVNNCAAALVLALNTLADGRTAIVSRGELIEIGGSFRIPEIMERSGARLVEVGTTNRTHLADYRRALEADGAIIPEGPSQQLRAVRLCLRRLGQPASLRSAPNMACRCWPRPRERAPDVARGTDWSANRRLATR
jgi:L-seryl-tRNA(Ser) seleniumtransferase